MGVIKGWTGSNSWKETEAESEGNEKMKLKQEIKAARLERGVLLNLSDTEFKVRTS